MIGSKKEEISLISAKTGEGVEALFNRVIKETTPNILEDDKLKALIFDSYFDSYKGVVASVRVFGGRIQSDEDYLLANKQNTISVSYTHLTLPTKRIV